MSENVMQYLVEKTIALMDILGLLQTTHHTQGL